MRQTGRELFEDSKRSRMMDPHRDRRRGSGPFWLAIGLALVLSTDSASPAQDGFIPLTSSSSTAFSVGDNTGHVWRVRRAGYVNSSSGAFGTVGTAMLSGSSLSFTNPMTKPSASELQLTTSWNNLRLTRRIRIDRAAGTCRFVDTFTNVGGSTVRTEFTVRHDLSGIAPSVVTDQQRTIAQGATTVRAGETGFVAWRPGGGNVRSLVCLVGTPTPTLVPRITNASNSTFTVAYPLVLEPKATWTVVHGVTVPAIPTAPNKEALAARFAPFRDPKWITDLPIATRRTIVNSATSAALARELESVLAPLARFCAERSITRGDEALLVVDDETRLKGAVEGEGIVVETDLGQTKISLEEIAAFAGERAGIEPRVFLRSGDVLAGEIVDCPLTFRTGEGTTIGLDPQRLATLVTARSERDGKLAEEARGLAVLASGQRITGRLAEETLWNVVSPWGPAELPAGRVRKYDTRRDPQPLVRLDFDDGSRLHVLVLTRDIALAATRFGDLEFPASEIDEWQVVMPSEAAESAEESQAGPTEEVVDETTSVSGEGESEPPGDAPSKPGPKPTPPVEEPTPASEANSEWKPTENLPRLDLIGENVLVGRFTEAKLMVRTSAGEFEIETSRIRRMENKSTSARPSPRFEFEVGTEEKLVGSLVDGAVTFRALDREWRIPAAHLRAYDSQPSKNATTATSKTTVVAPRPPIQPQPSRVFSR